jgi:predicted phosphodiesterase
MFKSILSLFYISFIFTLFNLYDVSGNQEGLRIWVLSDIQPRDKSDRIHFEKAIQDINHNIKDIDLAIVAGDIVNRTKEDTFKWYIDVKHNSYIKEWYEIAGNHDLKSDRGVLYKEKLNKYFYYKIEINNILFLFMSDEKRGKSTFISDDTFSWWKELVTNNQDKIIFVITHAPLNGSGIAFSSFQGRHILDSRRFRKVLKQNIVDMWLSGHLHLPHSVTNNITRNPELNNTIFLNVSSIRQELFGLKDSESFIIYFKCNTKDILVKSRNHTKNKYNEMLIYNFKLSKNYECS